MKNNKETRPMTKKEYIIWMSLSLGFFLLFFGMLTAAAILQDNGVSPDIYNPIGFSSFAFSIISLVILFAKYKSAMEYEMNAKADKVDRTEPTVMENVTQTEFISALKASRFEEKDEYLYKRKFSFSKDYINYFVRFSPATDVQSDIERETKKIDSHGYINQNKCLILVLTVDSVNEEQIAAMREFNKIFIVAESSMPRSRRFDSAVCMLLETGTKKLYILETEKLSISVYAYGTRLIKKLIKG